MNTGERRSRLCPQWLMMTLGIIMLLISPCVAHHHHGARLCQVVERCERDQATNDRHTAHHEQPQDEAGCVKKQGAVAAAKMHVKGAADHVLPLALGASAIVLPGPCEVILPDAAQGLREEAIVPAIAGAHGRRGPPASV